MAEPRDPLDEYDAQHGTPGAMPDKPKISHEDEWGENVNPVRQTPEAYRNLRKPGE